jgi:hypothetical protein
LWTHKDGNTETENQLIHIKDIIMEHKISVVIITLNEEKLLKNVCRNSFADEIIVVDSR